MPRQPAVQRFPFTKAFRYLAIRGLLASSALPLLTAHAEPAADTQTRQYAIAAGALDQVLNRFAREAGILLAVDSQLTAGKRSVGLEGRYDVNGGLAQLLAGTGLQAVNAQGNYALEMIPSSAGMVELASSSIVAASVGAVTEGTGSYTTGASSTATRLDLTPRQTPQTLVTLTRQQLEDFQLDNVNDALNAAGVNVQRVETDRTYFAVRGLDVSNFQLDGIGVPFSSEEQMGDIDTVLYDHIDVLKGANGLAANPGNPSATVNFVRKRPTRDAQAQASLGYGSWATRRTTADVSGPLNEAKTLRGRAIVMGQQGNSYLDRYSKTKNVFSGILEADLTDNSTLALGHSEQRNRPNGIMWSALTLYNSDGSPARYSRSHNTSPGWSYWDTNDKQTFADLTTDWGGGWQTRATVNYRETTGDGKMFMAYGTPDTGLSSYASKFDRDERQVLGDAYLKGPFALFGRIHQLVVGADWAKDTTRWTSNDDASGIALPIGFNGHFPEPAFAQQTSYADFVNYRRSYYGAGHFSLTDTLKLIVGANWSKLSSRGVQTGDDHDFDKSKLSPYYGLVYDFQPHYSAYLSYTKIFNPQFKTDVDGALLDPVEGNSFEGGIKGEWFDKRLNASLSLFRTRQDNYGEFDAYVDGQNRYKGVNIIAKGYELTVSGELLPGWEMNAGLTHLFSLRDSDGSAARTYTPQNYLYLGSTYNVAAVKGLKVGASMTWQSDIYRDQGVTSTRGDAIVSRQASYAVVNGLASYDLDEHWNVALNVNNLFDRKYLTSLYWDQSYYAASRNAMATVTWKY
ncbi:TonB-dependent siderophore receptor [Pseudomonas typographi]|uniref:TonB-dependent siderophore receptor n=1 Tax=Pseudomonas typographi TaxID=2715964 RepID=A0ABR7Z9T0_9PSED|nr:TonB-dependent receptor [Pseudomonas typographi]MBD1551623.1 TonB-dependent siderophore receptor [Pseudomonas typographi]MBD1602177.1 TonB-dependent siderophore receptor [Pseudomonas typographi]